MEIIKKSLSSRTVWTIIAMFIIGGTNAVIDFIPSNTQPIIMAGLGLLAIHFRINPKVNI